MSGLVRIVCLSVGVVDVTSVCCVSLFGVFACDGERDREGVCVGEELVLGVVCHGFVRLAFRLCEEFGLLSICGG